MRRRTILATISVVLILTLVAGCSTAPQIRATSKSAGGDARLDRTVLPIAEPDYPRATELDARDAKAPARFEVKAPRGSPNIIVFLFDDIGFGHSGTFGGQIPMPTLDRLVDCRGEFVSMLSPGGGCRNTSN